MKPLPRYEPLSNYTKQLFFCKVHHREATHGLLREGMELHICCDPDLAGICMPCKCVPATREYIKQNTKVLRIPRCEPV